jgi:glucokinase
MTPVLAVDVGGSTIKAEIQDAEHRPLLSGRRPTPPSDVGGDGRAVLDVVLELARELLAAAASGIGPSGIGPSGIGPVGIGPVRAVGVGVPGIVDLARGIGIRSSNLGWRNAPVGPYLSEALGLPVTVSHDVAAAGLAELRLGAGRGARDVLFVVIGTGIAGAVLAGGSLVTGGAGQAGEIGHIRIRQTGPRCGCGARGCLETFASARAVAAAYTERTGRSVSGAADVVALLAADADARAVWADAVAALADGLLITQAVLASQRVVLGGGLASAGSALLDPLAAALEQRATVQSVPELRLAELGERAGVVGVALAARAALA